MERWVGALGIFFQLFFIFFQLFIFFHDEGRPRKKNIELHVL